MDWAGAAGATTQCGKPVCARNLLVVLVACGRRDAGAGPGSKRGSEIFSCKVQGTSLLVDAPCRPCVPVRCRPRVEVFLPAAPVPKSEQVACFLAWSRASAAPSRPCSVAIAPLPCPAGRCVSYCHFAVWLQVAHHRRLGGVLQACAPPTPAPCRASARPKILFPIIANCHFLSFSFVFPPLSRGGLVPFPMRAVTQWAGRAVDSDCGLN